MQNELQVDIHVVKNMNHLLQKHMKLIGEVLELHKSYTTAEQTQFCITCARSVDDEYPCETVRIIKDGLNHG